MHGFDARLETVALQAWVGMMVFLLPTFIYSALLVLLVNNGDGQSMGNQIRPTPSLSGPLRVGLAFPPSKSDIPEGGLLPENKQVIQEIVNLLFWYFEMLHSDV